MRVLLIDQNSMLREGVRLVLESLDPELVIDEATSCGAVEMARLHQYDLVLTECQMNCQRQHCRSPALQADRTQARVIVFSDDTLDSTMMSALNCGAAGYISKLADGRQLCKGLQRALRGQAVVIPPPSVAKRVGGAGHHGAADAENACARAALLSDSQREMLRLLREGRSNTYIARELGIEQFAADSELAATFRVLGVASRAEMLQAVAECATG